MAALVAMSHVLRQDASKNHRRRRRSNKTKNVVTSNNCEEAFAAAQNGDIAHLRNLLERSAKRRWHAMTDTHGCTLLHVATQRGHIEIVRLLLSHGASVTAKDDNNCSPLAVAKRRKEKECEAVLSAAPPTEGESQVRFVSEEDEEASNGFVRIMIENLPLGAREMHIGTLVHSFGMKPYDHGITAWREGDAVNCRVMVVYDKALVLKVRRLNGFFLHGHRISAVIPKKTFRSHPDVYPNSRLFVSGFACARMPALTVDKLRKTFSAFGPLEEPPALKEDKRGFPIAFVHFEDVEAATAAREWLCGEFRLGGFLNVQFCKPSVARSDAGSVSSSRSSQSSFSSFSSASTSSAGRGRQGRGRGRGQRGRGKGMRRRYR